MAEIDVTAQLGKILNEYSKEVKRATNNSIDVVAKESVQKLKDNSPKKSGSYAKGWRLKRSRGLTGINEVTIHNATDYQLTHLLENGHIVRNKKGEYGRAPAHPHIAPVEDWIGQELPEEIRKELEE